MSDMIVVEFTGVSADHYQAVNKILQVDPDAAEAEWPAGLQIHLAGFRDGRLTVVEEWESQDAHSAFMTQLGPALEQAGLPEPSRMEWLTLVGQHHD